MKPTEEQETLIREQNLAIMATHRRDGFAQLTPINYAYKDGRILVSTTRDRAKYHNVRRSQQVSLCVIHPEGRPYVTVLGRATIYEDGIEEGTAEIFRRMSDRPLPENFGEVLKQQGRILIEVTPERLLPGSA